MSSTPINFSHESVLLFYQDLTIDKNQYLTLKQKRQHIFYHKNYSVTNFFYLFILLKLFPQV